MKFHLLLFIFCIVANINAQNFPHLNASTGNKREFIIDADSNIFMFHGSRVEKLDKSFNPIWIKNYSSLNFKNLLLSKTGSLYFIASIVTEDYIGKIEADGNLTWCTSLPSYTAMVSSSVQTLTIKVADQMLLDRNADLIITGVNSSSNPDLYLLKLDTTGNFIKLRFIKNDILLDPKCSVIINDVSGIYRVSSWGYGFEGPVLNLNYKYYDLSNFITSDSLFSIGYMGMTNQNPSSNEQIIKSKFDSNSFYVCNNTGAFYSTLQNTFTFRKIKNTAIKWGIQFQTTSPYLMGLQNVEEDNSKNVFLSVSCKNISTNKTEKWIVKVDSNGISDNNKYNLLQNFGKATMAQEDSITQLVRHYNNNFFYSIETSSSLPGPLSIIKMDSSIGSYCAPTASINVTSTTNYSYALNTIGHSTLTTVPTVTMQSINPIVTSVLNFSVITTSCLTLNTKEINANHAVYIYPNPATSSLNIISTTDYNTLQSSIYDVNGKLIFSNTHQTNIDVSKLNSGIYFINVVTNKGEYKQKFIKE